MFLLDIDIVVLKSPEARFDLLVPAAFHRGCNSRPHGSKINGEHFFGGENIETEENRVSNWGQTAGINAGVVLLEPNTAIYDTALREISA